MIKPPPPIARFLALWLTFSLALPNPAFALREIQTKNSGLEERELTQALLGPSAAGAEEEVREAVRKWLKRHLPQLGSIEGSDLDSLIQDPNRLVALLEGVQTKVRLSLRNRLGKSLIPDLRNQIQTVRKETTQQQGRDAEKRRLTDRILWIRRELFPILQRFVETGLADFISLRQAATRGSFPDDRQAWGETVDQLKRVVQQFPSNTSLVERARRFVHEVNQRWFVPHGLLAIVEQDRQLPNDPKFGTPAGFMAALAIAWVERKEVYEYRGRKIPVYYVRSEASGTAGFWDPAGMIVVRLDEMEKEIASDPQPRKLDLTRVPDAAIRSHGLRPPLYRALMQLLQQLDRTSRERYGQDSQRHLRDFASDWILEELRHAADHLDIETAPPEQRFIAQNKEFHNKFVQVHQRDGILKRIWDVPPEVVTSEEVRNVRSQLAPIFVELSGQMTRAMRSLEPRVVLTNWLSYLMSDPLANPTYALVGALALRLIGHQMNLPVAPVSQEDWDQLREEELASVALEMARRPQDFQRAAREVFEREFQISPDQMPTRVPEESTASAAGAEGVVLEEMNYRVHLEPANVRGQKGIFYVINGQRKYFSGVKEDTSEVFSVHQRLGGPDYDLEIVTDEWVTATINHLYLFFAASGSPLNPQPLSVRLLERGQQTEEVPVTVQYTQKDVFVSVSGERLYQINRLHSGDVALLKNHPRLSREVQETVSVFLAIAPLVFDDQLRKQLPHQKEQEEREGNLRAIFTRLPSEFRKAVSAAGAEENSLRERLQVLEDVMLHFHEYRWQVKVGEGRTMDRVFEELFAEGSILSAQDDDTSEDDTPFRLRLEKAGITREMLRDFIWGGDPMAAVFSRRMQIVDKFAMFVFAALKSLRAEGKPTDTRSVFSWVSSELDPDGLSEGLFGQWEKAPEAEKLWLIEQAKAIARFPSAAGAEESSGLTHGVEFLQESISVMQREGISPAWGMTYLLRPGTKAYAIFLRYLIEELKALPFHATKGHPILMRPDAEAVTQRLAAYLEKQLNVAGNGSAWDSDTSEIADIFKHYLEVFKYELYPQDDMDGIGFNLDLAHRPPDGLPVRIILERYFVTREKGFQVLQQGELVMTLAEDSGLEPGVLRINLKELRIGGPHLTAGAEQDEITVNDRKKDGVIPRRDLEQIERAVGRLGQKEVAGLAGLSERQLRSFLEGERDLQLGALSRLLKVLAPGSRLPTRQEIRDAVNQQGISISRLAELSQADSGQLSRFLNDNGKRNVYAATYYRILGALQIPILRQVAGANEKGTPQGGRAVLENVHPVLEQWVESQARVIETLALGRSRTFNLQPYYGKVPLRLLAREAGYPKGLVFVVPPALLDAAPLPGRLLTIFIEDKEDWRERVAASLKPGVDARLIRFEYQDPSKADIIIAEKGATPLLPHQIFIGVNSQTVRRVTLGLLKQLNQKGLLKSGSVVMLYSSPQGSVLIFA